ncbi:MAG: hypothetical protein QG605_1045 [Euryarchaeota archaeon]|nr:hypothetical protein [Euryarchaeota archaeon]
MQPRFELGQLVATPGALEALKEASVGFLPYVNANGVWGDVCAEDKAENELSLKEGFRLLSAYHLPTGCKIWIITEADRSATTILLPEEY